MIGKGIVGIVCEYNPFHNGHAYQIEKVRSRGYDTVVCVMSGNTVQRGEFSITDKYTRAECALLSGADLVLELPYPYSASGAEIFAAAGVRIISSIGANAICFGSESGDHAQLRSTAETVLSKRFNDEYRSLCLTSLGTAEAYFEAYRRVSGSEHPAGANDVLGVSYLKEIMRSGYNLQVEVITRFGSDYREKDINVAKKYPSATMLREFIYQNGFKDDLKSLMPEAVFDVLRAKGKIHDIKLLDNGILSYFRICDASKLGQLDIYEAGGGLSERILNFSHRARSYDELVSLVAGKKYTASRVKRAILHCLTGALHSDIDLNIAYSTVLGFNEKGRKLLADIRKKNAIPTVVKPSDAKNLGDNAIRQFELSLKIDSMYTLISSDAEESGKYITSSPVIVK